MIRAIALSLVLCGAAFAAPPAGSDSETAKILATTHDPRYRELVDSMREVFFQHPTSGTDRMFYTYLGPLGWSKPEAKLIVSGESHNLKFELVELKQHIGIQALESFEKRRFDPKEELARIDQTHVAVDAAQCPRSTDLYFSLRDTVLKQMSAIASESSPPNYIQLDAGWTHEFEFAISVYSSVTYSTGWGGDEAISRISELKKALVECSKALP